jgi:arylsulfatase A
MTGLRPITLYVALFCLLVGATAEPGKRLPGKRPNIVFVFADDMGYGDARCYNPASRIPTPNIDRLAEQGIRFVDAHCAGALCAPSRFGLMTGRDPVGWKNYKDIEGESWAGLCLPEMLRRKGYATTCVGKWHFGVQFKGRDGRWGIPNPVSGRFPKPAENWDLTSETRLGPLDRGFDTFFGTPLQPGGGWHCNMEGRKLLGNPSLAGERLPSVPEFDIQKWLGVITQRTVAKIHELSKGDQPFFLYLALNSPHKPIVPDTPFLGKSGIGKYGDYCHQVDWGLGQVMQAVDAAGIAQDTILIFTSDNGSYYHAESVNSSAEDQREIRENGHQANGGLRGGKGTPYEGGHRIPYIVRWPGRVSPGVCCDVPVSLMDHMATFAAVAGYELTPTDAPDSWNILPLWKGTADAELYAERTLFHFNNNPKVDAVRHGKWKLIPPGEFKPKQKRKGAGSRPASVPTVGQLYDLSTDLGEQTNLWDRHPRIAERLTSMLEDYLHNRRSAPHTKGVRGHGR